MSQLRRDFLRAVEAGVVGLFLVQAVRFLYATLYARASSADLVQRVPASVPLSGIPGVVERATVQGEVLTLIMLMLLPLLALIIHRWEISLPFAVLLVALGRSMALQTEDFQVSGASLVIGGGLLYMALVIVRRHEFFPIMLLLGLAGDQLIRALGNTYDHSRQSDYAMVFSRDLNATIEVGALIPLVSIALILFSILVWFTEFMTIRAERAQEGYAPGLNGSLNLWGGLALGGLLFLEFSLLALPNAVARWADVEYTGIVPWLLAATVLPLVPEVREQARRFAGMFDGAWRGWLWALLLCLLLIVGRRFDGIAAGIALVFAQFLVGLTLWWLALTGITKRNGTGLMVVVGIISFAGLAVGDYFTYDYAYVRDLTDPYQNVGSLLRSFRDMGMGLALVAVLLLSIPMILARKRIPWRGGNLGYTFVGLLLVLAVSFAGVSVAVDNVVRRPVNPDCLRVATLNMHGGYSQFFDPNLERIAQLAELNGVDVLMLQEIETGRLASFGVDQVLWLARRLDMEAAFFPQNEVLQGIAVLSRVPIEETWGVELPSEGNQAAMMRVVLAPERLVADPLAGQVGDLYLYNAWLGFRVVERDGQPIPEGEQDQNRQLRTMLTYMQNFQRPTDRIIFGGTFNFGPDSPLYTELASQGIQDPFAGLRAERTMTVYLVDGTAARYDYIWTFNVPLIASDVDNSPQAANASDHRSAIVAIGRREGITCAP